MRTVLAKLEKDPPEQFRPPIVFASVGHLRASRSWLESLLFRFRCRLCNLLVNHAELFLELRDLILQMEQNPVIEPFKFAVDGHNGSIFVTTAIG